MFEYPLRRSTVPNRVKENSYVLRKERRKPQLPGFWLYVSGGTGATSAFETWQSVPFQNSWDFVSGSDVAFRHGLDGETEYKGVLDSTAATSGTVAFTLPLPWRPVIAYSFITDMDLGGGDFDGARVVVNLAGEVRVYFPLTA